MRKITQAEFDEKVSGIFGDRLDISGFRYEGYASRGVVVCPTHGPYEVSAQNLLKGYGCQRCYHDSKIGTFKSNLEDFVAGARKVHGDAYSYAHATYSGAKRKLTITCPEHGDFTQVADAHLRGQGCPICRYLKSGESNRLTQAAFISRARAIHGDRYDLSEIEYRGQMVKVKVTCTEHGPFYPQAGNFGYAGSGCPQCGYVAAGLKSRGTLQDYVVRGAKSHNGRYGYRGLFYINNAAYLKVVCVEHGEFDQLAQDHVKGIGCSSCADYGFSVSEPASLYLYRIQTTQGDFVGFGVTKDITTRHRTHSASFSKHGVSAELLSVFEFPTGREAIDVETLIKQSVECAGLSIDGFRTEATQYENMRKVLDILGIAHA